MGLAVAYPTKLRPYTISHRLFRTLQPSARWAGLPTGDPFTQEGERERERLPGSA